MIELDSLATFTAAYPDDIARITHSGAADPLFTVPRLAILAGKLPQRQILAINADTREPLHDGTPPELLVQGIAGLNAEILIASIERDLDFDALIERTIRPLGTLTRAAGAPISEVASCIFVCSPNTSTDTRKAAEARIIFQCRGERVLEMTLDDGEKKRIDLPEGVAVYIPTGIEYRIENGSDVSVSLLMKMTDDEIEPKKTFLDHLMALVPRRRARNS